MRRVSPLQVGSVCRVCYSTPLQRSRQVRTNQVYGALLIPLSTSTPTIFSENGRRWATTTATSPRISNQSEEAAVSTSKKPIYSPAELANIVEDSLRKFTAIDGIPTKQLTATALRSCLQAAEALNPQLKRAEVHTKVSASRLASLGADRKGQKLPIDSQIQDTVNRISHAAYTIISQPNVEMDPGFLELYVHIQHRLGRPESLPSVLSLYATKAKPTVKNGQISYVTQNPNKVERAIEKGVAETALETAIEAKNLDAALGIIEAAYTVPAFRRQKLFRHATVPAMGLAILPFGILGLSSAYAAYWQNTMDITTATGIAVAGISGYFLVVGSLGMIAKLSAKDQMKRVTWTPGTPLRYRWLREEERAALDKVACAWGFKESWRHGEEMGPEWEGLKEYMGYRGMLLDRVEFMEGMR